MNQKERDEFIILKEDVKHTKSDVKEIKETVGDISENMSIIKSKLFKNELTGEEGYFEITRKNAGRLTKLENIKVAMLAVYGAVWLVIGWVIKSKL